MRQYDSISRHSRSFYLITLLFILLGLSACTTLPPAPDEMSGNNLQAAAQTTEPFWFLDTEEAEIDDDVAETDDTPPSDDTAATESVTESTGTEPSTPELALVEPEPAAQEPALVESEPVTQEPAPTEPEVVTQEAPVASLAETEPVSSDTSCKNSPYRQYEKQARASIAKGLSATTAGTYGVGFRNLDEHKEWSEIHNALFTTVNQACITLNECAKQHPEDKTTQCADQARQFDEWQNLAARFAEKAKQSETTQPPKICSFTADLDDAASCFHALADNIDNVCTTSDCKEASDCWRGIGFLDGAINQAASACAFVRTPLAECRGYVTATQRRKNKFERCTKMQEGLNVRIIPVL